MRITGITLILFICLSTSALGQAKATTVQSVLIYSTMKYMEWPDNSNGNLEVVVFGESGIYDDLMKISKTQKVNDRTIVVNKITSLSNAPASCHVFFVTTEKMGSLGKVLNSFNHRPVVIVTEKEGGLDMGSDLNFIEKNGKISFELSEKALSDKNIKVSKSFSALAGR